PRQTILSERTRARCRNHSASFCEFHPLNRHSHVPVRMRADTADRIDAVLGGYQFRWKTPGTPSNLLISRPDWLQPKILGVFLLDLAGELLLSGGVGLHDLDLGEWLHPLGQVDIGVKRADPRHVRQQLLSVARKQ